MVKLRKLAENQFVISVPIEKLKRKGWKGGEDFDCEFDQSGNLCYIEIKS